MTSRLLLVEDSRTQAEALAAFLETNGYETVTMRDGASALEYVAKQRPDLVLCDVLMPGIDGYEVCRRIKAELGRRIIPVVLLTSLNDPLAIVRALECGADSYVTKPFDPERLLARVASVMASASSADKSEGAHPVEIVVSGMPFTIHSGKEQILNLCVASYEDLVASSEEIRVAERRARFLAEAGGVLSGSLDADVVLEELAKMCVPTLADLAVVDVIEGTDERVVRRVSVKASNPSMNTHAERLAAHSIDLEQPSIVQVALRDGAAILETDVTAEMLRERSSGSEHLAALQGLCLTSLLVVPLVARGRVLGSLFLASTEGRRLDGSDLALATELSHVAGLALDNAQLYRAAQQASRARDDMLAIVSHDLRNPLHTITMSTGLLQDLQAMPGVEMPLTQQLGIIDRAANRANALIEDLMDVTRIEAGRLTITMSPQSVSELIQDAAFDANALSASTGTEVVGEGLDVQATVCADRRRIGQVFSNLVGNAVKFSTERGRVVVAAEVSGDSVRFSVSDNGMGIPAVDIDHVFDRFWQAERASRSGAGLGLFICRGIVEAHGGCIGVTSIEGKGSTFFFTLPVATGSSGSEVC
ncbi:MAG: ATP-binding protein [Gemmatimonadaceae bacterium]